MGILAFFRRLAADPTANVIVISAVALIPLLGMVGGAVDASRYYMTSTRLQAACDAGALAARRSMADDTFTTEDETTGENFFDQNYEDGLFGLEDLSRSYAATDNGEVNGTATGNLPTSLMHIFGYQNFQISVNCSADINISNTDIMFVLDVTGSMNCAADNPNGGNCGNSPDTNSKIEGLQDAVMTFYDTVADSTSSAAQVRYGVVPYASNVNVGGVLKAANTDWLAKSHTYQSREANFTTIPGEATELSNTVTNVVYDNNWVWDGWVDEPGWQYTNSQSACEALRPSPETKVDVLSNLGTNNPTNTQTNGNTTTVTYQDNNENVLYYEARDFYYSDGWCWAGYASWTNTADITFQIVSEQGPDETVFSNWTYKPVTYDLTTLYDDNRISLPIGSQGNDTTVTWDGCIEEATTSQSSTFDPMPNGAYDLDINLVPSNANEYWKPALLGAVWKRENSNGNVLGNLTQDWDESRPSYSCPTAAFRLTEMNRTAMNTYVNGLSARGSTYHDIGMIWGARFISPDGIFSAANTAAPNGDAISRHIVFMTDGLLSPSVETYNTYGTEWWDRRVTNDGSFNQAQSRHAERFQAACRAARQENIYVWVVAFGTALSQNLIDCATPGRSFVADDSTQLRDRFQEIAQKIAALRLTE